MDTSSNFGNRPRSHGVPSDLLKRPYFHRRETDGLRRSWCRLHRGEPIGYRSRGHRVFWRDIVRIIKHWGLSIAGKVPRNDPDARMGWLVIAGSIPIIVIGLFFQNAIEVTFRNLWIVATTLIVFGVILAVADAVGKHERKLEGLTVKHGILYGLAQCLALIPGVSRSGGTITAGLLMGYTREAAARYSFLLAIPAVLGSGFYELFKIVAKHENAGDTFNLGQTALATVIAFIVGYLIIGWFLKFISHNSYRGFVWYRIALGLVVFVLLGFGVIPATLS